MTLDETKKYISRKYLGQAGIHGIGLARAASAVRVYVNAPESELTPEQRSVVEHLAHDAEPYGVDLQYAPRAKVDA